MNYKEIVRLFYYTVRVEQAILSRTIHEGGFYMSKAGIAVQLRVQPGNLGGFNMCKPLALVYYIQ